MCESLIADISNILRKNHEEQEAERKFARNKEICEISPDLI